MRSIMTMPERRKHPRVKVYYPISYVCTDKKGSIVQQNMGVALNISQSGILIETADSVFSKYISLTTVDLNGSVIEIKGKIAYCKKNESTKYYNKDEYRNSPDPEPKTAVMF
ncbi:MAG: PilZ domain-containing protein [Flavobacteriaceae bacterium]